MGGSVRRDVITDVLDVLGLLLLAAGLAAAMFPLIGWACLALAGVVILAGSLLASTRPGKP
jgi:hypothetical protein